MLEEIKHIQNLIKSGVKENIVLAFQIAAGAHIKENDVLKPWKRLLNLAKISDNSPASSLLKLMNLIEFDIHDLSIHSLPPNFYCLKRLEFVSLKFINLHSLDEEIQNLQNLNWLNLAGNKLSSIPQGVYKLNKLKLLNLSSNEIDSLDTEIENLVELTSLNLQGNSLVYIPENIKNLKQLKYLDLSKNPIAKSEIEKVKHWLPYSTIEF